MTDTQANSLQERAKELLGKVKGEKHEIEIMTLYWKYGNLYEKGAERKVVDSDLQRMCTKHCIHSLLF